MPAGQHTMVAKEKKHEKKQFELAMLQRAHDYAVGHNLGAKATISTGLFPPEITWNKVANALKGRVERLAGERLHYEVLTKNGKDQLADWIASSARGKDPATDSEISSKVIQILKARRLENERRRHSSACVPLSALEQRLVTEADAHVSATFLSNFQAAYPWIQRKKERT